ncbi:hypothetical protein E2C01_029036 [Portunus trituberculatus]|uniref:Uncharacterized protein n=1 Tax=Portunus trituberculatus TaxID=210409 RepID=A0A5B7ER61_PORTR|nr:hypothetical protein [Portunus trituberculatus]
MMGEPFTPGPAGSLTRLCLARAPPALLQTHCAKQSIQGLDTLRAAGSNSRPAGVTSAAAPARTHPGRQPGAASWAAGQCCRLRVIVVVLPHQVLVLSGNASCELLNLCSHKLQAVARHTTPQSVMSVMLHTLAVLCCVCSKEKTMRLQASAGLDLMSKM